MLMQRWTRRPNFSTQHDPINPYRSDRRMNSILVHFCVFVYFLRPEKYLETILRTRDNPAVSSRTCLSKSDVEHIMTFRQRIQLFTLGQRQEVSIILLPTLSAFVTADARYTFCI